MGYSQTSDNTQCFIPRYSYYLQLFYLSGVAHSLIITCQVSTTRNATRCVLKFRFTNWTQIFFCKNLYFSHFYFASVLCLLLSIDNKSPPRPIPLLRLYHVATFNQCLSNAGWHCGSDRQNFFQCRLWVFCLQAQRDK